MNIIDLLQIAIVLAVSIGLHEYAHAYVSHIFGDPTPKLQGRLTPNPLKHIDPIGFLMIFLVHFGWGKPVQINPSYYKNPRRDELMVALAGPATNLVLAFIGVGIVVAYSALIGSNLAIIYQHFGFLYGYLNGVFNMYSTPEGLNIIVFFWMIFSFMNISLAVFNMVPLPPLDGFRLVKIFFWEWSKKIEQYQMYISIVLLIILLGPGSNLVGSFIATTSDWILRFFFSIFGQVLY